MFFTFFKCVFDVSIIFSVSKKKKERKKGKSKTNTFRQTNSESYLDFVRGKIEKLDEITCKSLKVTGNTSDFSTLTSFFIYFVLFLQLFRQQVEGMVLA